MIKSFRCRDTEALFKTGRSRRLPQEIQRTGLRRLRQLHAATSLADLRGVGASLENLYGERYSMRVNDRYRLCFDWRDGDAWEVEIIDYH